MKFHSLLTFALIMSLSPSSILANRIAAVPTIATQAGEYQFESVDVSSIFSATSSQMSQRELKQIEILKEEIKGLESQFSKLLTIDLQAVRVAASGGNKHFKREDGSFDDLFAKFDKFNNSKKIFEVSLKNLKSLPASLSDSEGVQANGHKVVYPSFINKHAFDSVVNQFHEQLGELDSMTEHLSFKIETSEDALEFISFSELEQFRAKLFFSTGELEEMRSKANKLRARMGQDERAIDGTFSKKIMEEMQKFISLWGHERAYRLKEFNEDQFVEDYESLQNYFYMRSALRIMYKIPIGTYGINHKKKVLNLDIFRSDVDLVKLQASPIRNSTDLKSAKDSIVNALAILEMRSLDHDPSSNAKALEIGEQISELFRGDSSLMEKVLSARSIIKGDMPLVQANKAILKLMLVDIQEELQMLEFGGDLKVKMAHKSRYSGEEDAQRFGAVKDGLVQVLNGKSRRKLDTNSVEGTLSLVSNSLKNMNAKISEANILEEKISRMEALTDRGQDGFEVDTDF